MTLNERLLAAHKDNDRAALVDLYTQAADRAGDTNTACFFLTHAYVFALEIRHPSCANLHDRLSVEGRI